ncbi:SAM-dependent methyltransferase, partial [Streptomyces tendae]
PDDADVVAGDLLKPREILASPQVERLIDLNRPVALLLVAILHFVEDEDDPYAAVAELSDALPPGSLLALTHASYEGIPLPAERAGGAVDVYKDIRNPLIMRSRDDIARFFEGYDMVEPGLVPMPRWRPEGEPEEEDPYAFSGFAGVGRTA